MYDLKRWCITVRGNLVGFERSRVYIQEKPYLDRWIIYFGLGTLRLHKFLRGDDDRAVHDHPWNFWTFPLRGYFEQTDDGIRHVAPMRWHRRASDFRHIVLGDVLRYDISRDTYGAVTSSPFYTFVVTGNRIRGWGFWPATWPRFSVFVPWREWK